MLQGRASVTGDPQSLRVTVYSLALLSFSGDESLIIQRVGGTTPGEASLVAAGEGDPLFRVHC